MKRQHLDQDRRRFLRDLALAGGVVTAACVPAQAAPLARATAQPAASPRGYQLTAHVSKYYEKARF